ncbi:uncharacterized protein LODBEIA_P57900 [Lodderomyces beijingensis]|uniref:RING-type domain-containing protein n=1 Tax=Lodderomyces beijingensis TaxID=1775926 RepID=A0ABP0ZW07_9ASCO
MLTPQRPGNEVAKTASPELKRYYDENCCFCHDSLYLTLPGEVILSLTCHHVCHKDCYLLMMDKFEMDKLPRCGTCQEPTRSEEDKVHQSILRDLQSTSKNFEKLTLNLPRHEMDSSASLTNTNTPTADYFADSNYQLFTPTDQKFHHDFFEDTPPSVNFQHHDRHLYVPNVSFLNETTKVRVGKSNEINYALNIKSPSIYNETVAPFSLSDFQLKMQVTEHLRKHLHLNKYLGDLIIFDKMKISIDGSQWDNVDIYLFKNYLLLYNDELLAGMISIENDLCSMTYSDGVLILNLSETNLPELNIRNDSDIVTEKWKYQLEKVKMGQVAETNLFQFTSTYWGFLSRYFEIPADLLRFSNLMNFGGELPNNFITKIVPPADEVALNLVLAVPLYNKTGKTPEGYKIWLAQLLNKFLSSLRSGDNLAVVFLGINGKHQASKDGVYVGCVSSSWDGWSSLINEIVIVQNPFDHEVEEMNLALDKCGDLIPFLPNRSTSTNKLILLSFGSNTDTNTETAKENIETQVEFNADNAAVFEDVDVSILRVGPHSQLTQSMIASMPFCHGCEPILRFDSLDQLCLAVEPYVKEHLHRICVPRLQINIQANEGVKILSVENQGSMLNLNQSECEINAVNFIPRSECNVVLKLSVEGLERNNDDYNNDDYNNENSSGVDVVESIPVFNYTMSWLGNTTPQKSVTTKIQHIVEHTTTAAAAEAGPEKKKHKNHAGNDLDRMDYMDIPLLPPLSPTRDVSFAKRQTELVIIDHLKRAIATKDALVLKNCISVAYGLMRNVSPGFKDDLSSGEDDSEDGDDEGEVGSSDSGNSIFGLLIHTRAIHDNNESYIKYLVKRLELIIREFESGSASGVDLSLDLLYALV